MKENNYMTCMYPSCLSSVGMDWQLILDGFDLTINILGPNTKTKNPPTVSVERYNFKQCYLHNVFQTTI